MKVPKFPNTDVDYVRFSGGLDVVTPPLEVPTGFCRDAQNYEIDINGGYKGITGYERFDGQAAPSDASYALLAVSITGAWAVGDTITGVTSGATAVIASATASYFVITKIVSNFDAGGEDIQISAVTIATSSATQAVGAASTPKLNAQYKNDAADRYRVDIAEVPGSGTVLGVWHYNDVKYAVRNNSGGTAAVMHKATASGWAVVPLGYEMSFTSGGLEYATGTVTLDTGAAGSVDGITVNSIEIMSGAEAFDTSLSVTATNVAANITANTSVPNYTAVAVGAVITITADTGGIGPNGFVVTSSVTTITTTDVNMAGGASNTAIAEGDTVTGETSTETAVVARVVLESGSWTAGTAAGRLIFTAAPSGAFTAAETLKVGSDLNKAIVTADATAITLTAGGTYEIDIQNFGGQLDTKRVYGASGVQRGFEFDGTVYVPIETGMSPDTPEHARVHKKHLFFSFGSSIQHSSIGAPYQWAVITGAAEIAVGDTITEYIRLPGSETAGGALAVFTKDSASILYGSSAADWNLVNYSDEQGGIEHTIQNIENRTVLLDIRGLTTLRATQSYGNFSSATLSQRIHTWITTRRNNSLSSCVVRDKSQYRVFFSDQYALYMTFSAGKVRGMMPIKFDHSVDVLFSGENNSGTEEIYFGSSDGFVYQMEKGTSFDGEPITRTLKLAWNPSRNVRQRKRYKRVMFELSGDGYAEYSFRYELGYNSSDISQAADKTAVVSLTPVYWDSFTWDQFTWDGVSLLPSSLSMEGSGENVSLIIQSSSDYFAPTTFSGALMHYIRRRGLR